MNHTLFDAFADIDPRFIEEAAAFSPIAKRRHGPAIVSAVAAAALAVAIVPTAIFVSERNSLPVDPPTLDTPVEPDTPGDPPSIGEPDPPSATAPMSVGETRTLASGSTLTYLAKTEHSVTIRLHKTDAAPVYLRLTGRRDTAAYYASTDPRYAGVGERVQNGLTVTVNGSAGAFPSAPGDYEIVVDFTPMRTLCTSLDELYTTLCAFYL